jgi:predicted 2-oxoglutarate/Fe(II)-dependent dioxygenase YbiX
MTYNKPDTKLDECIFVAQKIIPADLCDAIVQDIEKRKWKPHEWYVNTTNTFRTEETKELDIQYATPQLQKELKNYVIESGRQYNKNYAYHLSTWKTNQMMNFFSTVRFNRYTPGQIMRQHHDHIHSIFDGQNKGIPVLSFIMNFNDDYEGADLFFWEDTIVKLGKGDIVMFPSNWLFPHGVTEATKGKRYSGVCWAW